MGRLTLREALERGKLDRFIAEREDHPPGDREAFGDILNSMAGKCKPTPETSDQDECDD